MRVFLECTNTRESSLNTGIQRVVRNIVNNLKNVSELEMEIKAVYLEGERWYPICHIDPPKVKSWTRYLRRRLREYRAEVVNAFLRVCFSLPPTASLKSRLRSVFVKKQSPNKIEVDYANPIESITFKEDDVLVLLDASWKDLDWFLIEELRAAGVLIICVFYDLIPITNPEFYKEPLRDMFSRWAKSAVRNSDYVLAISQSTLAEVRKFSENNGGHLKSYGYFYLGSDLDGADKLGDIRDKVQDIFNNGAPVYVTVGTVEPRKNHACILKAFKQFMLEDSTAKLLIVGKCGWLVDEFVALLKSDGHFNTRILWIQDATDSELEYIYGRSKALIFASFVEGFGLPLIEARQRGLPVIASDIPVFREIADDFIEFFDVNDPADLCRALKSCPEGRHLKKWMTWQEATANFCSRIKRICHGARDELDGVKN